MKRSFYEILGVAHDASEAAIADAYGEAVAKLEAKNVRGVAAARLEMTLLHEGYLILTDPHKRRLYDAKLAAAESGVELMYFPEGSALRRRLTPEFVVLVVLVAALGGLAYAQLSSKMEEVRIEHATAVARKMEELNKVRIIDARVQPAADVTAMERRR